MKYVQDFGDVLWFFGIFGGSALLLQGLCMVDRVWRECNKSWFWFLWGFSALLTGMGLHKQSEEASAIEVVCLVILAIYLIICTVMDSMLCLVNDVVQLIGVTGAILFVLFRPVCPVIGVSLILFTLFQKVIFLRFYGGADGMAFLICSLFWAGMGKEIDCYLMHMTVSYVALLVVQVLSGNVSLKGKLKEPVAMVPYITLCFLFLIERYQ